MSKLNFEYVPLTFINDKEEIKKQVRNTLILIYLFEKYNNPVRLETLIEGTQYGFNASALQSGKNKFLRISDIYESKVNWETVPYCNCDDEKTYLLKDEDILIARTGGTTGKSFKIHNPPKHSIYAGYLIRIRAKAEVNPDYIYLFLHSFAYWSQIVNLNERNFRPKANAENLKALILPDCPKDIQDEVVRIAQGENVNGYKDLFLEIEKALGEYDKIQMVEELLAKQLTQIENLNQAILQEAVQGKLVKQDKKDEPASELLNRIKAEKAKSGKKEKPLPPIKPEEIPFEIPDSWVWCRLGEISDIVRGGSPRPAGDKTYYDGHIPFLKVADLTAGNEVYLYEHTYTIKEAGLYKTRFVEANTLMLTNSGATLGYPKICTFPTTFNDGIAAFLNLPEDFDKVYLFYFLKSLTGWFLKVASRGQGQPNLNTDIIGLTLFPIPPKDEQKRIVTEIEKQVAKTKQLEEHIIANQEATEQLLKALLHQAFEVKEMEEIEN
jgi:type I restriction enzyme, S subunit